MDTRDGKIWRSFNDIPAEDRAHCVEMQLPPTPRQLKRMTVGRNDPCPCDSGLKFKKCCLRKAVTQ